MFKSETQTLRQFQVPVAQVIAATGELIAAIGEAALSAQLLVVESSVADSADTAAEMRPLVIVLPEHVYQTDAGNFEALARDIRSRLMRVVDGELDPVELRRRLETLMAEAEAQRPSWNDEL